MVDIYHHGVKGQKWGVRNDKKLIRALSTSGSRKKAKILKELRKYNDASDSLDAVKSYNAKQIKKLKRDSKFNRITFRKEFRNTLRTALRHPTFLKRQIKNLNDSISDMKSSKKSISDLKKDYKNKKTNLKNARLALDSAIKDALR